MSELALGTSIKVRNKITKTQAKEIMKMYKKVSLEVKLKAEKLRQRKNVSSIVERIQLKQIANEIDKELLVIGKQLNETISKNMELASKALVNDEAKWLTKNLKFPIEGMMSNVPHTIVKNVKFGLVYEGKWSLSEAIWKDIKKNQKDINDIVAKGILQNKSVYEIAKDLEKYVDPSARKTWKWNKVYPGTASKIDYNAQRLARTMVSHAYEQSVIETNRYNPFVEKIRWISANTERTCEVCLARDGKLFDKDSLPLDHPNGLCTFAPEITDNMKSISDRLANWANGESDEEIDEYVNYLYDVPQKAKYTIKETYNI